MTIIECDYHPGFQQIAFVDTETGNYGEQRSVRRVENAALMLENLVLRPDSRGCEVPESSE
jgi:hypothetical protein